MNKTITTIEERAKERYPDQSGTIEFINMQHIVEDFREAYIAGATENQPAEAEGLHPDSANLLKVCFEELRAKMAKSEKKYGWTNEWLTNDWEDECRKQMIEHLKKGDPRDVAIYAMFMMFRGWSTKPAEAGDGWTRVEELVKSDPISFFMTNIMRYMNEEQIKVLIEKLIRRYAAPPTVNK